MSVHFFCSFLKCGVLRVLYRFWMQVLRQMYIICQYFSQPEACLLTLLAVSFEEQKFWFRCSSICSFMDYAFGFIPQKSLPNQKKQTFSLMFSSRKFIVLEIHQVYDPFWIDFCMWWEGWIKIHYFTRGYLICWNIHIQTNCRVSYCRE